jgi:hypothetical protein
MAIRTARSGTVRWARGAVIALLAALAVLVHHEIAAGAFSSMQTSMPGMQMPGMEASAATLPMGPSAADTEMVGVDSAAHSGDDGACAAGMQHCATASVDTMKLITPPQGYAERLPNPYGAVVGSVTSGVVGRAPPDLSVLSQLRI